MSLIIITSGNLDELIPMAISDEAKARITTAANQNLVILVPREMVTANGDSAIGWMEVDATGHVDFVSEDGGRSTEATAFILVTLFAIKNSGYVGSWAYGFTVMFYLFAKNR